MNDSHNYLGSTNWWAVYGSAGIDAGTIVKIVPPAPTFPIQNPLGGTVLVAGGIGDAGSTVRDAARTEANDFWNNKIIRFTSGANSGISRVITDFLAATDDIVWAGDLPAIPGVGDTYDILSNQMANRLVITWYHLSGNSQNAAECRIFLRCFPTTGVSLLVDSLSITNSKFSAPNSNIWLPLPADESIQIVTTGALTGNINLTIGGKIFPSTHTGLADKYTGLP